MTVQQNFSIFFKTSKLALIILWSLQRIFEPTCEVAHCFDTNQNGIEYLLKSIFYEGTVFTSANIFLSKEFVCDVSTTEIVLHYQSSQHVCYECVKLFIFLCNFFLQNLLVVYPYLMS